MPRTFTKTDAATPDLSWRSLPRLSILDAARLLGVSRAMIYALAERGRLTLLRDDAMAGRTFVETASVVRVLDAARPFTPTGQDRRGRALTLARRAEAAA